MANLSSKTTALKPGQRKKATSSSAGESPIKAKKNKTTTALGGGEATVLKKKSELYLTAISTFAGEDTFYESGEARINRIVDLVHDITARDPEWIERFVAWLRGPEANIRTISLIIAAEYVKAGGPKGRQVIDSVCQRADEPAEVLAWWMQRHYGWDGKSYPLPSPKLPQALRKGLGDAVRRLYNEYSAMKYNGNNRGVSMRDVLNLLHVKPRDEKQGDVFAYVIAKAYGNNLELSSLPLIAANHKLRELTPEEFRDTALNAEAMKAAGVTWEQVGGFLGGAWTAEAWEAVIPQMGYMALLRNLRNFEQAGISKKARKFVTDKLSDPEEVAKSRQLPFRFLSAYKNMGGSHYLSALEDALDLSVQNIPEFDGKTLVLVDLSGSMSTNLSSGKGRPTGYGYGGDPTRPMLWEVGALFGVALALNNHSDTDIVGFGTSSKKVELPKGGSVLKNIDKFSSNLGVGHGTQTQTAVNAHYKGHDRVVIFTDVQPNYGAAVKNNDIPFIHYFDLGGYGQGAADLTKKGRFQYGGFSDSTFKLMNILEHGDGEWPF